MPAILDNAFTLDENGLYLNFTTAVLSEAADPSTGLGEAAPIGSIYLRTNGVLYIKTAALDTDWTTVPNTADLIAGYQPLNTNLTGLSALATTGVMIRTGAGTFTTRTITGTTDQIFISNGDGIAANPTISIATNPVLPGTTHVVVPTGTTAQETGTINGAFRYDTDTNTMRMRTNGTWKDVGSGNGTVTSVAATQPAAGITITGSPITTSGTLVFALADDLAAVEGLTTAGVVVRTGTSTWTTRTIAGTIDQIVVNNGTAVLGDPTVAIANNPVLPGTTHVVVPTGTTAQETGTINGAFRYDTDTNTMRMRTNGTWKDVGSGNGTVTSVAATQPAAGITITGSPITTSGTLVFALADDLAAVEGLATTGLAVRTGTSTWTTRSLTQPAAGITISNNDGVAGNPTFALANDLAALEGLAGTGIAVRTAADTWAQRTITGTTNRITVTNGDGVAGNPTVDIAATYVGQTSITTLGTITTGTWNGTTIAVANGGTGVTTTPTNGQLLIGNGTGYTVATLTAGTNISITNGAGSITINTTGLQTALQLYRENPSTPTTPTASGTNAVAIGNGNVASATESIALGGLNNTAGAQWATAIGSRASTAIFAGFVQASGRFAADGDAQTTVVVLRQQTTDATAQVEMFIDGVGGSQRLILPNDTTWAFRAMVVARRADANNESAAYEFSGCIDRNATAGSTAIVGVRNKTIIAEDIGAWDSDLNADTTNGALRFHVTGQNAKTINWVARVELTQVTG